LEHLSIHSPIYLVPPQRGAAAENAQELTPTLFSLNLRARNIRQTDKEEDFMEQVNLSSVIENAITRFSQNRVGDKPPVFVTLAPALPQIPWKGSALRQFLQFFLYESLLTSDANAPIEIALRRRSLLKDLTAFVGLQPSYWVQLRVSGRGLRIAEQFVEDLFTEVGYRCEEWIGMDGSEARLGIFGTIDAPKLKMVFCLESNRHRLRCDLLLPVVDKFPVPGLSEVMAQRA